MKISGLPPILPRCPHVLILGSMPSMESLRLQQYYAHPRNAFWGIMGELLGFDAGLDYQQRTRLLRQHHIAVWDVLARCERPGSLDSAIKPGSEETNDIVDLLQSHDSIRAVLFNGGKSAELFDRHIRPELPSLRSAGIHFQRLLSTSPANARYDFREKCAIWGRALEPIR